jgi:hypothetical protein
LGSNVSEELAVVPDSINRFFDIRGFLHCQLNPEDSFSNASIPLIARACRSTIMSDLKELSFDVNLLDVNSNIAAREFLLWNKSEIVTKSVWHFSSMHPHCSVFRLYDAESGIYQFILNLTCQRFI